MTALLLDTHAFIWFSENDSNLLNDLRILIERADRGYVSLASLWEIAIKLSFGKLALQKDYATIEANLALAGMILLPISFADTVQVCSLEWHHRDPFDRLLVAQAMTHALVLISRDTAFDAYPIQRLW